MALLKVKTQEGWVQGIPGGNQMISIFRGIPYAAPPVGELRWKKPQPVAPWDGVRKCIQYPNICWQERMSSEGGGIVATEFYSLDWPRSEDCLYVNVWTPAKSADEKLPVAVYMHGGGFSTGYGFLNCYDGEGFGKRGVVFVTINHRLNLFGFLAHPWLTAEDEHHTSGNYGALDLIAALEWVKRNIAAFGGDPDNVTIFGQSGGGGKVQTMITSPLSKHLMKRAIMQSGGGLSNKYSARTLADGEAFGVKFFEFMGFKNLEEARAADPEALLNGLKELSEQMGGRMAMMRILGPKVDGYLLPESPTEIFLKGQHPDIDYMCGCTSQEMYNPAIPLPDPAAVRVEAEKTYGSELAKKYVAATHIEDDAEKARAVFTNFMGETATASVIGFAENEVRLGRKPAHIYYLTLVPPGADTAHHSAEHHYVFQTLNRSSRPYTGRDWDLSNQLCDYWSNFIKTGDPNGSAFTGGTLPRWEGYTAEAPEALEITYYLHMAKIPTDDFIDFMVKVGLDRV